MARLNLIGFEYFDYEIIYLDHNHGNGTYDLSIT